MERNAFQNKKHEPNKISMMDFVWHSVSDVSDIQDTQKKSNNENNSTKNVFVDTTKTLPQGFI